MPRRPSLDLATSRIAAQSLAVAGLFAVFYLLLRPATADFAAQVYRTNLFEHDGFTLWNSAWYGGHHTPGYSILFPPLAAIFWPRVIGIAAALASALIFDRLVREHFGDRARIGSLWFAAATATNLFSGRLTFALGVAFGLGALLAVQRGRRGLAVALAVLCPAASPVAGLFLAMAAVAAAAAQRRVFLGWLAVAAFVPVALLAVAFPEGGTEPFVWSALWPLLLFSGAVVALLPREQRTLRVGAGLYAAAAIAAYVLDTPMGGNVTRLGALFAGPIIACALWKRRPKVLLLLALPLLFWQWSPAVRDIGKSHDDPSTHSSYYAPLNAWLSTHGGAGGRIEVLPTRNKYEAAYVAERFTLARGWERQLDVKYNGLFYVKRVDPEAYRRWLATNGVRFVAVPDVKLDYAGTPEANLIAGGLPYLKPEWRARHWHVYRVLDPSSLVSGPARLESLGIQSFALSVTRPSDLLVRVRFTPYWEITRGSGCVERGPKGFTRLSMVSAGEVRVAASFDPSRVLGHGPRCSGTR